MGTKTVRFAKVSRIKKRHGGGERHQTILCHGLRPIQRYLSLR